jgi:hypothetical protein
VKAQPEQNGLVANSGVTTVVSSEKLRLKTPALHRKTQIVLDFPSPVVYPILRRQSGTYFIVGAHAEYFEYSIPLRSAQVSPIADFPFTANAVNVGIGNSISVQRKKYFAEVAAQRMAIHDVILGASVTHMHGIRVSFGVTF